MEPLREHSAGGVILEDGRVLLILMKNLKGELVWTFPKGHLEPGETAEQAAVRELLEETGWQCELAGHLCRAHYAFTRGGAPVEKDVDWFLARRAGGDGAPRTPDEVRELKWVTLAEAGKTLSYPSDLRLLEILKKL